MLSAPSKRISWPRLTPPAPGPLSFQRTSCSVPRPPSFLYRSGPATHPVVGVLFVQAQELADQAMEHFNPYAFAHVAIYGKPYLYAAAETLQLIRQCGITTVINDSLINPLLLMVSIVGGFIIGIRTASASAMSRPWGLPQGPRLGCLVEFRQSIHTGCLVDKAVFC